MQLDINVLKFINSLQWKCLKAIEKNHKYYEHVPLSLIVNSTREKENIVTGLLGELLHYNLVSYEKLKSSKAYRLTWKGFDYLALKWFIDNNLLDAVGQKIGIGKEADVNLASYKNELFVIKIYRIGRTSSRNIKTNRKYLQTHLKNQGWIFYSIKSAETEYNNIKNLTKLNLPIVKAIAQNRHCILMEYCHGHLLSKCIGLTKYEAMVLFDKLLNILYTIAKKGYVHGDFNEFNIIVNTNDITNDDNIHVIDFPQAVSINETNSRELFNNDLNTLQKFFMKKYRIEPEYIYTFEQLQNQYNETNSLSLVQ